LNGPQTGNGSPDFLNFAGDDIQLTGCLPAIVSQQVTVVNRGLPARSGRIHGLPPVRHYILVLNTSADDPANSARSLILARGLDSDPGRTARYDLFRSLSPQDQTVRITVRSGQPFPRRIGVRQLAAHFRPSATRLDDRRPVHEHSVNIGGRSNFLLDF
jgi:hypothetical protein